MLKYARAHNFSSEQLGKLGHIFNTAKAVEFLKVAEDRAANFRIVDVPGLQESYTEFRPESKAATAVSFGADQDHDWALPNFWETADNQGQELVYSFEHKAAREEAPADHWRTLYKQACENRDLLQECEGLSFELLSRSSEAVTKFASVVVDVHDPRVYPAAKSEVLRKFGSTPDVLAVLHAAEHHMEKVRGLHIEKQAVCLDPKQFVRDSGGWFDPFAEALDAFRLYQKSSACMDILKEAVTMSPDQEKAFNKRMGDRITEKLKRETGAVDEADLTERLKGDLTGTPVEKVKPLEIRDPRLMYKDEKDESKPPKDLPLDFDKILGAMGASGKGVVNDVFGDDPGPLSVAKRLALLQNGGKDRERMKLDAQLEDDETSAVLQRLVLTDPIVSKADPTKVADIMNTIREANPEVAKNYNLAGLVVREALQYGSVPVSVYKDLLDMRKTREDITERGDRNTSNRYSTGAALA